MENLNKSGHEIEQQLTAVLSAVISHTICSVASCSNEMASIQPSAPLVPKLNRIAAQLYEICSEAKERSKAAEKEADASEVKIEELQDKLAALYQQSKHTEDVRNQRQAEYIAAETEHTALERKIESLCIEIEGLSSTIRDAEERQRIRDILKRIPFVCIFAAIEEACSGDSDTIKNKGWELQETAKNRDSMQYRMSELEHILRAQAAEISQLETTQKKLQVELQETVDASLQAKHECVKWSRAADYYGELSIRVESLVKNTEEETELFEWLDAKHGSGQQNSGGNDVAPIVKLSSLSQRSMISMEKTPFFGGSTSSSEFFDDLTDDSESCYAFPNGLYLRSGDIIDGIRFCYRNATSPLHGGDGGQIHEIPLEADEYITGASGTYGDYWNNRFIWSLTFTTSKNRTFYIPNEAGRWGIAHTFTASIPQGNAICGIYGETAHPLENGSAVNSRMLSGIGFYYRPMPRK